MNETTTVKFTEKQEEFINNMIDRLSDTSKPEGGLHLFTYLVEKLMTTPLTRENMLTIVSHFMHWKYKFSNDFDTNWNITEEIAKGISNVYFMELSPGESSW